MMMMMTTMHMITSVYDNADGDYAMMPDEMACSSMHVAGRMMYLQYENGLDRHHHDGHDRDQYA